MGKELEQAFLKEDIQMIKNIKMYSRSLIIIEVHIAIVWILSVPPLLPPVSPYVKGMVPSLALFGDGENLKRWGLLGGL
jgi:hypothetical protein